MLVPMSATAPTLTDYATHSPFSDPGAHAELVRAVAPDPGSLHAAVCDAVVHYRGFADQLSPEQAGDIDSRWTATILGVLQDRSAGPLGIGRTVTQKVAGCCRDHALLAVATLREHGVPARSRIGFSGYFRPGFHHDHVVAERWDGSRWLRFDPELAPEDWPFDVHDMPTGEGAPFETAAEAWLAIRAGRADASTYGVDPAMPWLTGPAFVRTYVGLELAHRMREEVLLWDGWHPELWAAGEPSPDGSASSGEAPATPADEAAVAAADAVADEVAELLVTADRARERGDDAAARQAEAELAHRYAHDARLRPGGRVLTMSPTGRKGTTDLTARTTTWA